MSQPEPDTLVSHNKSREIPVTSSDGVSSRKNPRLDSNGAPVPVSSSNPPHDSTAFSCSIVNPTGVDDDAVDERWSEEVGMSEDILPLILDNLEILTAKDLFNFRFVSRCWRDVATSVLLKRSVCDMALGICQLTPGSGSGSAPIPMSYTQLFALRHFAPNYEPANPPIFKYLNARPPHSFLPDLIQVISTSPKFPSNSITFGHGCELALVNLSSSPANENHLLGEAEDHLLRLFSLYGKKIKNLFFLRETSTSTIQKLLNVHLPNVICLNLRNCPILNVTKRKENQIIYFPPLRPKKILKLEFLYMGMELTYNGGKIFLLEELVTCSPNLREVHDAGIAALSVLVRLKKVYLIKSFNVNLWLYSPYSFHLKDKCTLTNCLSPLKLRKLTMQFGKTGEVDYLESGAIIILNRILQETKDSLEYLELLMSPNRFLGAIQFPSMKKLKCLSLIRQLNHYCQDQLGPREAIAERSRLAWENLPVKQWVDNLHTFRFENEQNPTRIPLGYFPALSEVLLDVDPASCRTYHKLLAFFTLEHRGTGDGSIIPGDILPSVTTLELTNFPYSDVGLGKLFPNLTDLKIQCLPPDLMSNWVWAAFPKLERFELYDFVPNWEIEGHYSFFTGVAHEVCTKIIDNIDAAEADGLHINANQMCSLRTRSYIGDCASLKNFTLKCNEKFSCLFLTKLARLYETEGVTHKGKIIFSFESVALSKDDIKEIQDQMKLVSSKVEIQF